MDEKKQNELAILKEALQRARSNGGEARRNADKLAGEILSKASSCISKRAEHSRTIAESLQHRRVERIAKLVRGLQQSWRVDRCRDGTEHSWKGSEPNAQSRRLIERKLERVASIDFNIRRSKMDFHISQLLTNLEHARIVYARLVFRNTHLSSSRLGKPTVYLL